MDGPLRLHKGFLCRGDLEQCRETNDREFYDKCTRARLNRGETGNMVLGRA